MKPIIQKLWMFIAVLCASHSASAYDFKSDKLYYNILSEEDRTVEVTYYNLYEGKNENYVSGDIDIPRKLIYNSKTYTVTSIGAQAFYSCSSLTSVNIPNSVTSIVNHAFSLCSNLTSVTIPNSVTSIGEYAFSYCSSLTSVTIPNSVTYIGYEAFYNCSSLTSVTIPNSVTYIGDYAFSGNLKTIYMQREVPIECNLRFSDNTLKEAVLYVPAGTKTEYEKVDPWRNFWNIEEMDFSGIDGIEADEYGAPHISVSNGILTIDGIGSHESVTVYDMQGRILYNGTSHTIDKLSPGLYIVKAGSKTMKISI